MNKNEKASRFFKNAELPSPEDLGSLKNVIKDLENRLDENSSIQEELAILSKDGIESGSTGSNESYGVVGEQIDLPTLQKFYVTESWVYIAVWSIARTIATLPLKMEKRKVTKENLTNTEGEVTDSVLRESWIEANAEPEFDLLAYPNDSQLPVEFWMLIIIDLLVTGNAYILVDKDSDALAVDRTVSRLESILRENRKLNVQGLYRLNSALMEPKFDDESMALTGYTLQAADGSYDFNTQEIIHIRLPNPADPILGLAPLVPVLKNVLIDRYSSEHMIRFYKQGARLGGVVKTSKKLTKEQVARLTRSFESNYTGKRNHHKTLILPEGMDYQTIEVNPGETSLIEFSKFNKEPILSAYGVPPIKVGLLDGATYANAVVQDKSFWENAALPIKAIIESAINNSKLILRVERNLRFSFDTTGIKVLQESLKDQAETAQRMMQSGLSVNEVRQEVWKKAPVTDGDLVPAIAKLQGAQGPFQLTAPTPGGEDEDKSLPDGRQPDLVGMTDIEQTTVTYEARLAELVAINLQAGIPLGQSVAAAVAQATLEGFSPEGDKTEDDEEKPEDSPPRESEEGKQDAPDSKEDKFQNYCKILTGQGVTGIMERKFELVKDMFTRMESLLMKEVEKIDFTDPKVQEAFTKNFEYIKGKSLNDILLMKVDEEDDLSDLPIFEFLKQFVEEEAIELRESEPDLDALKHGFENTLMNEQAPFPNSQAQDFLEERGAEQVRNITETTRAQIKNVVAQAYEDQASPDEISMRIAESFEAIKEGRARTITRTETLTAVSQGQEVKIDQAAQMIPNLRENLKKRWITAQDSRVRDSHIFLDGDVVNDGEKFGNGLGFPREPGSPAKEAINCRCAVVYFVEDDESDIEQILPEQSLLADVIDSIF